MALYIAGAAGVRDGTLSCTGSWISYDDVMNEKAPLPEEPLFASVLGNRFRVGFVVFLLFLFLWAFFVWPALSNEWWAVDDYITARPGHLRFTITSIFTSGRPLYTLWIFFTRTLLDFLPWETAGILVRTAQGSMHALCAVLIGFLLVRFTGRKIAICTVLPFLVWPFGSEPTTWIAAAIYPIGALLSVSGLAVLLRPRLFASWHTLIGMFLLFLAPFANQSAGIAGLVVFCILAALSLRNRERRAVLLRALPILLIAYALAVVTQFTVLTLFQEHRFSGYTPGTVSSHIITQGQLMITYLLTSPYLYPTWLIVVQLMLFLLALIAAFPLSGAHTYRGRIMEGAAVTLLFGTLPLLLRAPTIFTGMDWVSGRTMYLDPLLFTFALCIVLRSRLLPIISTGIVTLFIITLLIGYYPISTVNAREHVTLFNNDVATLRHLETVARQEQVDQLIIAYQPYRTSTFNPYLLRYYNFGDIHHSILRDWQYSFYFMQLYSQELHLLREEEYVKLCAAACTYKDPPGRSIEFIEKPVRALCFCP